MMGRLMWGAAVGLTSVAWMAAAHAQTAPASETAAPAEPQTPAPTPQTDTPENDIVVTAQRRAERLEAVPVAITALTQDTITKSGVQRMTDLGQIAAGIQVNRSGAFTQPAIRGITSLTIGYGFENNVAIYVDGFYQPDMVTINGDLANLASVQVLKGPQGSLYGRNATGGAIVIETLAPSREFTASGTLSYGRLDDRRAQAYVSGPIADNLSFGFAAYYRSSDGYIRDIGNNPASSSDDYDAAPLKNVSIRTKLQFAPSDKLKFTLGYNHGFVEDARGLTYTINRYPSPALPLPPARATARDTTSGSIKADANAWVDEGTLRIDLQTGIGTLRSYTGYAKRLAHSNLDFDASKPLITQSKQEGINQYTLQQTLDYAIDAIPDLNLVIGGFFYDDKLHNDDGQVLSAAGIVNSSYVRLTSRVYALYIDGTYKLADNLWLTGGLRYNNERRTIAYRIVPGINPVVPAPGSAEKAFTSATPRVALRYEVAPRTSVYASYSQGFRSGVFSPFAPSSPALLLPIKPERIKAYEIGFKTASSTLRFDTAAYYYDFRDLQVGVTVPNPLAPSGVIQLISNATKAEVYGAEAQLTYTPTAALNLRGGIAWTHARYRDFTNATGTGLNTTTNLNVTGQVQNWSGQEAARAPGVTANLGGSYDLDLAGGKLSLAANASYTASYVVSNPSLYGPLAGPALATKQRYRQGAYALVNAQINWTTADGHYTVGVYADNITNTRYNFVLSGGAFGDYSQASDPATYGVRAGFKF